LTIAGTVLCPISESLAQRQPPAFEWATRIEATNTYGWDIDLDVDGSPVVVGEAGSVIGLGSTNIPHTGPGGSTGMALRMNANGTFQSGIGITGIAGTSWVRVFGVDATSPALLVCGSFGGSGETDFGEITLPPSNSQSGFIASYTSDHEISWVLRAVPESSYECYIRSTERVGNGNILAVGNFSGAFIDINGTTIQKQPGPFEYDLLLLSIDDNGSLNWLKRYDGGSDEIPEAMAIDGAGNILITGHFSSQELAFGETTLTNRGLYDGFVAKFDASGNPLWAKSIGTSGWDM